MTPDVHPLLVPLAPLADLPVARAAGSGVIVSDCDGFGLAMVLVRKGKSAILAQQLSEHFHIELPQGPYRAAAGDLALMGTGPGAWLATLQNGGNAFAGRLRHTIGGLASVSDQRDAYAVLRLAGPKVRDTLCKLVPVDVHPRAFKVGDVAVTVAAHMGATLWRLEDQVDNSPVFEIAVFRSFAEDFWQALSESAAEFGLDASWLKPLAARTSSQVPQAQSTDTDAELQAAST